MREIELGKLLGKNPQPNIVKFIGCVTTEGKKVAVILHELWKLFHGGCLLAYIFYLRAIRFCISWKVMTLDEMLTCRNTSEIKI